MTGRTIADRASTADGAPDTRHALRLLPTGVPGLDAVLGGGLPEFSFTMLAGGPGAGKTILAPQFRAKYIPCVAPAPAPTPVRADAEKLGQILLNLLTNALKFTEPGGRVGMRYEGAADAVEIRVRDTGRGIVADQLEAIFEPFLQVGRTLTSADGGVGLGLAISRELARGIGGDLTAGSELGRGSTFTFTLDRAGSAAGVIRRTGKERRQEEIGASAARGAGRRDPMGGGRQRRT